MRPLDFVGFAARRDASVLAPLKSVRNAVSRFSHPIALTTTYLPAQYCTAPSPAHSGTHGDSESDVGDKANVREKCRAVCINVFDLIRAIITYEPLYWLEPRVQRLSGARQRQFAQRAADNRAGATLATPRARCCRLGSLLRCRLARVAVLGPHAREPVGAAGDEHLAPDRTGCAIADVRRRCRRRARLPLWNLWSSYSTTRLECTRYAQAQRPSSKQMLVKLQRTLQDAKDKATREAPQVGGEPTAVIPAVPSAVAMVAQWFATLTASAR